VHARIELHWSHPLELATLRLLQGVSSPPVRILEQIHCKEEGNRNRIRLQIRVKWKMEEEVIISD
jgi:hypothetical protein